MSPQSSPQALTHNPQIEECGTLSHIFWVKTISIFHGVHLSIFIYKRWLEIIKSFLLNNFLFHDRFSGSLKSGHTSILRLSFARWSFCSFASWSLLNGPFLLTIHQNYIYGICLGLNNRRIYISLIYRLHRLRVQLLMRWVKCLKIVVTGFISSYCGPREPVASGGLSLAEEASVDTFADVGSFSWSLGGSGTTLDHRCLLTCSWQWYLCTFFLLRWGSNSWVSSILSEDTPLNWSFNWSFILFILGLTIHIRGGATPGACRRQLLSLRNSWSIRLLSWCIG